MLYRCYAKINLTLEILRRRNDGFHELASLVHTVSLGDDLRVEPADELLTRVEGLELDPETNLVSRAAALMSTSLNERRGAELSLVKRIPAAAGLGGGSSDAAATLAALNTLWGSRLNHVALGRLAAQLGSDVPFFLRGGAAVMRGRGEQLEVLPPRTGQWLVVLVPPHDVLDKTRRLYGALAPADFSDGSITARAVHSLACGEVVQETDLVNAFTRPALEVFAGLDAAWHGAEKICERRFFLSGAGPALFAFASGRGDANEQVAKLAYPAYAVRTVRHARASAGVAAPGGIEYP
ncbi:MAG: 4-(cytidine 5'-diphospho)-2-C-methyl-D-erythritol kinase [Chloroflexi bacterium]|nr:4-(cytidine 5'-diphospho)-2-C-methyl-D-erythritol kinase [Chloroflexota bacterium]